MAYLHLFWDGEVAPDGWSIVSDVGGPFYQKMIRGNSTYGGTGGAATHTHTTALVSCSGPSTIRPVYTVNQQITVATTTHTHTIGSIASDTVSNLPNYRSLKVIKCNTADTPSEISQNVIAIFDTSTMTGYTKYSAQDNLYIYCDGTAGITAGSNTHLHTVAGETGAPSETMIATDNASYKYKNPPDHTHNFSQTTDNQSNEPPYLTAYMGKKDAAGAPVKNMIGMWDATPPEEWVVISADGGDFYQRFVKAANSYNIQDGISSHSHANVSNISEKGVLTTVNIYGEPQMAERYHTHTIEISLQADVDHTPPYIDVIFAKYSGPAGWGHKIMGNSSPAKVMSIESPNISKVMGV